MGVENLGKSSKFYEETLGLRLVDTGPGRAVYDARHLTLYIIEGEPHPPVLSLTIENLRAAKQRRLERGCDIVDERERSLYFRDPAGVVFDATQPA